MAGETVARGTMKQLVCKFSVYIIFIIVYNYIYIYNYFNTSQAYLVYTEHD